jgi:hypothetical protein
LAIAGRRFVAQQINNESAQRTRSFARGEKSRQSFVITEERMLSFNAVGCVFANRQRKILFDR